MSGLLINEIASGSLISLLPEIRLPAQGRLPGEKRLDATDGGTAKRSAARDLRGLDLPSVHASPQLSCLAASLAFKMFPCATAVLADLNFVMGEATRLA
jgi:hypothetical protein